MCDFEVKGFSFLILFVFFISLASWISPSGFMGIVYFPVHKFGFC